MTKLQILMSICIVNISCGAFAHEWRFVMPALCPDPWEKNYEAGTRVSLDQDLSVEVACENGQSGAGWVRRKMRCFFGVDVRVVDVPYSFAFKSRSEEAYALIARPGVLRICARTLTGVKWAMATLRQIAQPKRGTITVESYEIPALEIKDAPDIGFRGLHICVFPECSISRIERQIRLAAYYKFNYVVLESWGTFKSTKHPWFGWKDGFLSVSECRRLTAMARDLGVTLIPQLNVLGHATVSRSMSGKNAHLDRNPDYQPLFEPNGGWNWCLTNPNVRRVIEDLVMELHEAFGAPPYFHIGCDEAEAPSCAVCCAVDYRKLIVEYVNDVARVVEKCGARPMMWHDMLLDRAQKDGRWRGFYANGDAATSALVGKMTRRMVICDWYYGAPQQGGQGERYPTLDYFTSAGYDTLTCPWKNPKGIRAQCSYAREHGLLGVLGTMWHCFQGQDIRTIYTETAACAWSSHSARSARPSESLFALHMRQVGWDTPGGDAYEECGWYSNQVSPATNR